MGRFNRITRLFYYLRRSFWVMPMIGCMLALLLAVAARAADRGGLLAGIAPLDITADGARDVLGAVAGATATMMSLTYTLTLLIFTLAAGQLGPRLLDSFYDNRVNQITIAVMGATFVFAMTSLYLVDPVDGAPVASVAAIVLSLISVPTLIYFVHDVSQRVLIDNEASLTGQRLRQAIRIAFRDPGRETEKPATVPERDPGTAKVVTTRRTGYLRSIDMDELVEDLSKRDAMVELLIQPGEFLIARMPVAMVLRSGEVEDWQKTIDERLICGKSRASEGDILFSANLLTEVALRALSPGINDSFTAICAIDHLSGAFGEMLNRVPRSPLQVDGDGTARVIAGVLQVEEIIDTAFDPIRRNATGNMIVSCALLDALRRMIEVSDERYIAILRDHAVRIEATALPDRATEEDRRHLAAKLIPITKKAA